LWRHEFHGGRSSAADQRARHLKLSDAASYDAQRLFGEIRLNAAQRRLRK
jgi:hypothetical protein